MTRSGPGGLRVFRLAFERDVERIDWKAAAAAKSFLGRLWHSVVLLGWKGEEGVT